MLSSPSWAGVHRRTTAWPLRTQRSSTSWSPLVASAYSLPTTPSSLNWKNRIFFYIYLFIKLLLVICRFYRRNCVCHLEIEEHRLEGKKKKKRKKNKKKKEKRNGKGKKAKKKRNEGLHGVLEAYAIATVCPTRMR
jgi:hypothetical protein